MKEEFEAEDFCTAVFDEFFFTCINVDNVVRHLMRLLWWVHPKLPPARLETLLKVGTVVFIIVCCLTDCYHCLGGGAHRRRGGSDGGLRGSEGENDGDEDGGLSQSRPGH